MSIFPSSIHADALKSLSVNAAKLKRYLIDHVDKASLLITDVDTLAEHIKIDVADVRCSATVLLIRGDIADICPGGDDKIVIRLGC